MLRSAKCGREGARVHDFTVRGHEDVAQCRSGIDAIAMTPSAIFAFTDYTTSRRQVVAGSASIHCSKTRSGSWSSFLRTPRNSQGYCPCLECRKHFVLRTWHLHARIDGVRCGCLPLYSPGNLASGEHARRAECTVREGQEMIFPQLMFQRWRESRRIAASARPPGR